MAPFDAWVSKVAPDMIPEETKKMAAVARVARASVRRRRSAFDDKARVYAAT